MADKHEDGEHEPNSYGFSGGATAPEPGDADEPEAHESPEDREAERIAVPDDLAELFGDDEDEPQT
jgi:hypothetical protein